MNVKARDIKAGEELLFDYGTEYFKDDRPTQGSVGAEMAMATGSGSRPGE
jgi:SET domain-containing protein